MGCGKRESAIDKNLEGLTLGPVLADPALAYLQAESSAVTIGDYDQALKVMGRDNYWMVDYAWFFLPRRPLQLKTFAEMHALEKGGEIDTSTVVSTIIYRMGLEAGDEKAMKVRAAELRPKVPPPLLIQAVEDYIASHRVSSTKK